MRTAPIVAFAALAAILCGCGDPAPSTPLAPDIPPPDTSKFSQEDINRFHEKDGARGPDRQGPPR